MSSLYFLNSSEEPEFTENSDAVEGTSSIFMIKEDDGHSREHFLSW